jgi:hypothetical protein
MFKIFYIWGPDTKGAAQSDPVEYTSDPGELADLAFYTALADDLARQDPSVDELVEWDAARLLGQDPPAR